LGVALYTMASLQTPFMEENIKSLFNSIVYKQPKPLTQYSVKFTDFVKCMLAKKKEDRPIIVDLIDYF
jgi:serine/threonine protein kinase